MFDYRSIIMATLTVDLDIRVFDKKDYVPFDQVMDLLRKLDEHTPNVDLKEIAEGLTNQRNSIREQ